MPAETARLLKNAPALVHDQIVMDYDQRLMRRKLLFSKAGREFLVDLPNVTNLDDYWGFELPGPIFVQINPAPEAVLVVRGPLTRLAWHIGNRHTPCQILPDRLIIREDHVLEQMLLGLGATIQRETLQFRPEGGAYGHGRTMGHAHANDTDPLHAHTGEDDTQFGWHHHGDGNVHFHGTKAVR